MTVAVVVGGHGGAGHRGGAGPAATGRTVICTDPPTVVVLGDSTALTLGVALAATAPSGTTVANGGLFGCGLAIGTCGVQRSAAARSWPMFPACNAGDAGRSASGRPWTPRRWRTPRPGDVVLFVAGTWEVQDILPERTLDATSISRRSSATSSPRCARWWRSAPRTEHISTSPPCPPWPPEPPSARRRSPMDSPGRRLIYDRLIAEVAAEFPGTVSVIDYGEILSPRGVYTEYLDGVQVRTPDGIHTPAYAPGNVFVGNSTEAVAHAFYDWLSPRIWPLIIDSNLSPGSAPASAAEALPRQPPDDRFRPHRPSRAQVPPRPSATGKERITALDGLRAVALLIIMGYHFGVGWLQGGFFSLDIFYVLSGYLITGLLVSEYRKRSAHQAVGLLAAPGPAAAAGAAHRVGGGDPDGPLRRAGRSLSRLPDECAVRPLLLLQLVADRRQRQLLRGHRRRCHRSPTPGPWPSRSSST